MSEISSNRLAALKHRLWVEGYVAAKMGGAIEQNPYPFVLLEEQPKIGEGA